MESFEKNVKKLVSYLKNFSLIEFYHEEKSINKQMKDLTGKLDNFEGYLPKTKLMATEIETVKNKIKVEVRDRIKGLIKDVDHSFAIKNYQEILNKINENKSMPEGVRLAYKRLGPFDHYEHVNEEVAEDENQRIVVFNWETRPSGAMHKGQVNAASGKADGWGLKIWPNGSMYEGRFEAGQISGYGRGITVKGEIYQGEFLYDSMDGEGVYQFNDGRIYIGQFESGKKSGKGVFMYEDNG